MSRFLVLVGLVVSARAAQVVSNPGALEDDCVLQAGSHLVKGASGDLACQKCPPHTYGVVDATKSILEKYSCQPCPAGSYTFQWGSLECRRNTCKAGTHRTVGGSSLGCEPCAPGTYQDEDAATECKKCPDKKTSGAGAKQCTASKCKKGEEDRGGNKCVKCKEHFYSKGGGAACVACEAGTFAFGRGNQACAAPQCAAISGVGQHVVATEKKVGNKFKTVLTCKPCPKNTQNLKGHVVAQCEACPLGFSSTDGQRCVANNCKPGSYLSFATNKCVPCAKGSAQPLRAQTKCAKCTGDTVSLVTGAAHCVATKCVAGKTSVRGQCQKCPLGTYAKKGDKHCRPCKLGTFALKTGATKQADCAANTCAPGTYLSAATLQCVKCAKGTYNPHTGAGKCMACEEGSWSYATGATECEKHGSECSPGQHWDRSTKQCQQCPTNTFAERKNQVQCFACPHGQYQPKTGQASCKKNNCGPGHYCDGFHCDIGSSASCKKCPVGTVMPVGGALTCTPCKAPQNAPKTGLEQAFDAPKTGMEQCERVACALGTGAAVVGGRAVCTACAKNYVQRQPGTWTTCKKCPEGTDAGYNGKFCHEAAATAPQASTTGIKYQVCSGEGKLLSCKYEEFKGKGNELLYPNHVRGAFTGEFDQRKSKKVGWDDPNQTFNDYTAKNNYRLQVNHNTGAGRHQFGDRLVQHRCGMIKSGDKPGCKCWCWDAALASVAPKAAHDYHVTSEHGISLDADDVAM